MNKFSLDKLMTKRQFSEEFQNMTKKTKQIQIFQDIPEDTLSIITLFLDGKSLFTFQQCSKKFYQIVEENKDLNWKGILSNFLKRDIKPYSRFFENFYHGLENPVQENKINIETLRDIMFVFELKKYKFTLPIDDMGGADVKNNPFIAIPKSKVESYEFITEESAEKFRDEHMYEVNPKMESYKSLDLAFETMISEFQNNLTGNEEYQNLNDGKTAEKVESLKEVKKMFQKKGLDPVFYQKVHYYWDDGEYNQGEMMIYGVTKSGNVVGFAWGVYHNV